MKRQSLLVRCAGLLSTFMILATLAVVAFGQAASASLRGVVKDPQGNVVPGATVTLVNPAINFSRTTTSTNDGVFTFEQIPVGDYRVEVEAKGFKKAIITDIHALVSKVTPIDVSLDIGSVSETVTVAAEAGQVLLNRDDATLGNNFVKQQITQLPLEARSPLALLTLQPAVTREG